VTNEHSHVEIFKRTEIRGQGCKPGTIREQVSPAAGAAGTMLPACRHDSVHARLVSPVWDNEVSEQARVRTILAGI